MLSLQQLPNFCGVSADCPSLLQHLLDRSQGWREACPSNLRKEWVGFHVACATMLWDWNNAGHDMNLIRSNAMQALFDLQTNHIDHSSINISSEGAV